MPCSVKRIGRRTSDRLSPRRLCISAKNVTFVLHSPCVARKTKTAPPWEPSHFFWKMRATTGRHYKVNISNFRTENAGDGWSPAFVFPFRLLPFFLPRQPIKSWKFFWEGYGEPSLSTKRVPRLKIIVSVRLCVCVVCEPVLGRIHGESGGQTARLDDVLGGKHENFHLRCYIIRFHFDPFSFQAFGWLFRQKRRATYRYCAVAAASASSAVP